MKKSKLSILALLVVLCIFSITITGYAEEPTIESIYKVYAHPNEQEIEFRVWGSFLSDSIDDLHIVDTVTGENILDTWESHSSGSYNEYNYRDFECDIDISYNEGNGLKPDGSYQVDLLRGTEKVSAYVNIVSEPIVKSIDTRRIAIDSDTIYILFDSDDMSEIYSSNIKFKIVDENGNTAYEETNKFSLGYSDYIGFDVMDGIDLQNIQSFSMLPQVEGSVYFSDIETHEFYKTTGSAIIEKDRESFDSSSEELSNPNYEFAFYGYNLLGKEFTADLENGDGNIVAELTTFGEMEENGLIEQILFQVPKANVADGSYHVVFPDLGSYGTYRVESPEITDIDVEVDKNIINVGQENVVTFTTTQDGLPVSNVVINVYGFEAGTTDSNGNFMVTLNPAEHQMIDVEVEGDILYGMIYALEEGEGAVEITGSDIYGNLLDNIIGDVFSDTMSWGLSGKSGEYYQKAIAKEGSNKISFVKAANSYEESYYMIGDIDVTPGVLNVTHMDGNDTVKTDFILTYNNVPLQFPELRLEGKTFDDGTQNPEFVDYYSTFTGMGNVDGEKTIMVSAGVYDLDVECEIDGVNCYFKESDLNLDVDKTIELELSDNGSSINEEPILRNITTSYNYIEGIAENSEEVRIENIDGVLIEMPIGFSTSKVITREELSKIISNAKNLDSYDLQEVNYSDVDPDSWAADSIKSVSIEGIMTQDEAGLFRPKKSVTRAEIVGVIYRAFDIPTYTYDQPKYPDVLEADREAVESLDYAGILSGYPDGTFRPDRTVTIEEALTIIIRAMGISVEDGGWPDNYINTAYENGILDDIKDVFSVTVTGVDQVRIKAISEDGKSAEKIVFLDYMKGDVNMDGIIDTIDLNAISENYGRTVGLDSTLEEYDLNGDGIINIYDLVIGAKEIK